MNTISRFKVGGILLSAIFTLTVSAAAFADPYYNNSNGEPQQKKEEEKKEVPAAKPVEKPAVPVTKPQQQTQPQVTKPQQQTQPQVTKPQQQTQPQVTKPQQQTQPQVTKPQQQTQPQVTKPQQQTQPQVTKPVVQQPDSRKAADDAAKKKAADDAAKKKAADDAAKKKAADDAAKRADDAAKKKAADDAAKKAADDAKKKAADDAAKKKAADDAAKKAADDAKKKAADDAAKKKVADDAKKKAADDAAKRAADAAKKNPPPKPPTTPPNPVGHAVKAPGTKSSPAEKQATQKAAKSELTNKANLQAAQVQKQQQAVKFQAQQAQVHTANVRIAKTKQVTEQASVKQYANASQAEKNSPQAKSFEAGKSVDLKKLDSKKTTVRPLAKAAPLPAVKPGITLGANLRAPLPRLVAPPNRDIPAQKVNGKLLSSHLMSPVSQRNIETSRTTVVNNVTNLKQRNVTVYNNVVNIQKNYYTTYNTTIINRTQVFNGYWRDRDNGYRRFWSPWWSLGFFGGYYYPVVVVEPGELISLHFWCPTVFWLYADSYQPDYYAAFYDPYAYYHAPIVPFRYVGVYYPSTVFIDFATEMYNYSYERQWGFRTALTNMTDELSSDISAQMLSSFYFNNHDIVINHYQYLGDALYEVEGFVDRSWLHIPFKATIDLDRPYDETRNIAFAPLNNNLNDPGNLLEQIKLNRINQLMAGYSQPYMTAYQEPEPVIPVSAPVPTYSCTTFSADFSQPSQTDGLDGSFDNASTDVGTAQQTTVAACSNGNTFSEECSANVSCNDQANYPQKVTCTASASDSAGNSYSFVDVSRDPDLAYSQATKFCSGAQGLELDPDACASSAAVSCYNEAGVQLPQYQYTAYTVIDNNRVYPVGALSFSQDQAKQNAKDACAATVGANLDLCNDDSVMVYSITNGAHDPSASGVAGN